MIVGDALTRAYAAAFGFCSDAIVFSFSLSNQLISVKFFKTYYFFRMKMDRVSTRSFTKYI